MKLYGIIWPKAARNTLDALFIWLSYGQKPFLLPITLYFQYLLHNPMWVVVHNLRGYGLEDILREGRNNLLLNYGSCITIFDISARDESLYQLFIKFPRPSAFCFAIIYFHFAICWYMLSHSVLLRVTIAVQNNSGRKGFISPELPCHSSSLKEARKTNETGKEPGGRS